MGELASISDKGVVSRLFRNTMQKLLKVTQNAGKAEYSKKSNSMAIDEPADESSPSAIRFLFSLILLHFCHLVIVHCGIQIFINIFLTFVFDEHIWHLPMIYLLYLQGTTT